jgi:hypothetical protein
MRRTALALACSLLAPFPALAADAALQPWKAYAQRMVAPDFAWAQTEAVRAPSVLDLQRAHLARQTEAGALVELSPFGRLQIALADGQYGFDRRTQHTRMSQALSPLSSAYAATTLVQPLGPASSFSLTAIVARQRFATRGFGSATWEGGDPQPGIVRAGGRSEYSHGSGVRMGLDQALTDRVALNVGLQSRLEMDAFKTYRGVYSEAGDFDVPGYAEVGLRWSPSPELHLIADVQRVFYGQVDPFTSAVLPQQFLSLLGDGSSPQFAWRDLTVYALETARDTRSGGRWSLRYSSQQQPRPSSALLDLALSSQYSNINLALGFQQALGTLGRLQFGVSYSPASYVLATTPFVQRNFDGGSQVEFEAHWSLPF